MLQGNQINLRRIEQTDLWQLWQWHEQEGLFLFNKIDPLIAYDKLKKNFYQFFHLYGDFIIESKNSELYGVCSYRDIWWKNRMCKIDFALYLEENYDTIAHDTVIALKNFLFNNLNLLRIYSYAQHDQALKADALKQTGFRYEGTLREHLFNNGAYTDVIIFSLSRQETACGKELENEQ